MSARLKELQQEFQRYILHYERAIEQHIVSTDLVPAKQRLDIYANAYRSRLVECLMDDFPGLHTLLGDEAFETMCLNYIEAHPSQFRSVRWFGDKVAEYLSTTQSYAEQAVLSEMARFEWALTLAFDAADVPAITIDDMAKVPPEHWAVLQLEFHAAVQRMDFEWNVVSFWKAVRDDEELEPPQKSKWPVSWLIWRQDQRPFFRSMDVDEAWAMDAMRHGSNFAEVCAGMTEWIDAQFVAERAAGFLQDWISSEMVTGLKTTSA